MSDLGLEIREQLWDTDTHAEENARTHHMPSKLPFFLSLNSSSFIFLHLPSFPNPMHSLASAPARLSPKYFRLVPAFKQHRQFNSRSLFIFLLFPPSLPSPFFSWDPFQICSFLSKALQQILRGKAPLLTPCPLTRSKLTSHSSCTARFSNTGYELHCTWHNPAHTVIHDF